MHFKVLKEYMPRCRVNIPHDLFLSFSLFNFCVVSFPNEHVPILYGKLLILRNETPREENTRFSSYEKVIT